MVLSTHRLAEHRSLALHEEIAERIREAPAVVIQAVDRVHRWRATGALSPQYADRWLALLAGPMPELLQALVDPSERGRALRQTTPFSFVVSPRRRWQIWRTARLTSSDSA